MRSMLSNTEQVKMKGLGSIKSKIPKFNHSNYLTWELKIQVLVRKKKGQKIAPKGKEDKLVEITNEDFYENDSWPW